MSSDSKNLWQSKSWADFQESLGTKVLMVDGAFLLVHPLKFGKHYGYFQRGAPRHPENLRDVAKIQNIAFFRLDPFEEVPTTQGHRWKYSSSKQPETTLVLDLRQSEDQLRRQMKRKGRYNIQLAQKKGVEVRMAKHPEERKKFAECFYHLLQETTERDGFSAHGLEYYQKMLQHVSGSEIFVALYDETPLAAAITVFHDTTAIYYYGASSQEKKELMAPYLLQWEMICEAKRRGLTEYDFLGIAPEDANKNHPWAGLTEFKKKFGGRVVKYPKPIDIIISPFWHAMYRIGKFFKNPL